MQQVLSPKALGSLLAMDDSKLRRSASLPSPSALDPPPTSITRPYKLAPTLQPSALLQRRSKANQGLYPVDAPDPSPPQPQLPSAADRPLASAYEILRVPPSASQQDIKTSFWRLARQHHPDKAPAAQRESSSRLFLQIHAAYNTLRDPQSRARYDLHLSIHSPPPALAPDDVRKPHFCSPSPRIFATHNSHTFTPRTTAANAYTPRSQPYTPRSSSAATPSFTPRTPYSGRNWETDQCW